MPSLAERAAALLRDNDRGRYTVPSSHLYPHQWAWDSAFAAIGWARVNLHRALVELETLMQGQWTDGRVPHIIFHDLSGEYFPNPDFWETERTSSITNPPVWTLAARRLLDGGADRERLRALLPAMDRSHRFFRAARDPNGWGLVAIAHPWEGGMDNSPAWDVPLANIDPKAAPSFRRVDTTRVGDASQRPSDDEYKRYAVIVKAIAANEFGIGPFLVYDPWMSTLLALAERDLAHLARSLGEDDIAESATARAVETRAALDHLWSEEAGRYVFVDTRTNRRHAPDVISAYAPLLLDTGHTRHDALLRTLRARYWTAWPLPTTAPDSAAFDAKCYWRGPAWVNVNWLFAPLLGDELRSRTLELVERSGFCEYFNPLSGEGLGATHFTWTAALVLDWLAS